jgi:hypothetical protein
VTKRQRWHIVVLILLGAAGLAAALEPFGIVRGFLRGEVFYRGRPASYWKRLLKRSTWHGQYVPGPSLAGPARYAFTDDPAAALPVLREGLQHPDADIRSSSAEALGYCGAGAAVACPVLVEALHDPSPWVRTHVAGALASIGPAAAPWLPAVVEATKDADPRVAATAVDAVWRIDPKAALAIFGWRELAPAGLGFRVVMPTPVEQEDQVVEKFGVEVHSRSFTASYNRAAYSVTVGRYPPDFIPPAAEETSLEADLEQTKQLGAQLMVWQRIVLPGHEGREHMFAIKGKGIVRSRLFWVGQRQYMAIVSASQKEDVESPQAVSFLTSFRLEDTPVKGREPPTP